MDHEKGRGGAAASPRQRADHVDYSGRSGSFISQGKKYVMHAGDIMIIPPNVPHEFWFTQDTIDIDIFSPQRQDWMDGTADYLKE